MKSKLFAKVMAACVSIMLVSGLTVSASTEKKESYVEKKGITIEYFGHSSFGISNKDGMQIVTDPYDPMLGYKFPSISTNLLTVSHDHFDHNNVAAVESYEELINTTTGSFKVDDIKVKGISTYHDGEQGASRGTNTIYTYEINNIKVCHLGDLGHQLSKEQINSIGKVDVLMIPVGGFFTIESEDVISAINSLDPKVVIPMHYVTETSWPVFEDYIAPVSDFTSRINSEGWTVNEVDNLTVTKQMLNTMKTKQVFVLDYK
ncbi:MBL fold metallo-hydrolase [Clostridium sp.]|uniref:MBL fold metallo-hydrolase n=1 Tax=Clostridium sp. TaxID=1506 RepID=UPI002FCA7DBB